VDSDTAARRMSWAVAAVLFALALATYASRMAPSVVPGDPGEYQTLAARWGIGHPPGYGVYALVSNLFTHLLPVGTYAWRANLLAAVCGAAIVALVYGIGLNLGRGPINSWQDQVPSILGALALGAGIDLWQHAIHANAHVLTALLAAISLFCLIRWERLDRDRAGSGNGWLYLFCIVVGTSPVQHPLLVFAFPAYAAFILSVRPRILLDWRRLLRMVGCVALGLAVYLYYPLRSAIGPPPAPGPTDMHTWDGFVSVVTARGLRVNLLQFSLGQVLQRVWDVRVPLGLQYNVPTLLLAALGLGTLWRRRWRTALLLTSFLACVVLVTVNILQDAMAYLLGPMVVVGVFAGAGASAAISWLSSRLRRGGDRRWISVGALALFLLPAWSATVNWTRMDLSDFRDADAWLEAVDTQFRGQVEPITLLTEWERMTTVYYYAAVEGHIRQVPPRERSPGGDSTWVWDEIGVRFVPVYAGLERPFVLRADEYLSRGPVYLTTYRPQVAAKYRLMPVGSFWQVLTGWPRDLPDSASKASVVAADHFEIVGWRLSEEAVRPGEVLSLDLYMRMQNPEGVEAQQYYLPWAKLGEVTYHFTTDSRFHTPWWQAGEIVVERFDLPVSWSAPPGLVPLQVGVELEGRSLALEDRSDLATLTEVEILPARWRPPQRRLNAALGNLGGAILLRGARVDGRRVPRKEALALRPGAPLRVVLDWESLRPIEENYTVFVQLLDATFWVHAQSDITPLGGSAPTLLWFPRWRRGTRIADTHVLHVPPDLPPGEYPLVVGMYGFSTHKRVQVVSSTGDMSGDWITLAHLKVE